LNEQEAVEQLKMERENLKVSFNIATLAFGWAELELALGANTFTYRFEFIPNNPLTELVKSALDTILLRTVSTKVCFHNCSDTETVTVYKQNEHNCLIVIHNQSFEITIKQFARELLKMFDRYQHTHEQGAEEEEWRRFFPTEKIERLRYEYHSLHDSTANLVP